MDIPLSPTKNGQGIKESNVSDHFSGQILNGGRPLSGSGGSTTFQQGIANGFQPDSNEEGYNSEGETSGGESSWTHDGTYEGSGDDVLQPAFQPTSLVRSHSLRGEQFYETRIEDRCNEEEEKHCWVCFASEEDDTAAVWTHPCKCSGTTKWVHQACIQRWVDEKQKGNIMTQVQCPQCETTYTIRFPTAGFFVTALDSADRMVQRMCPIVAGGVCVGSLYWTCVTYGAVSVMQIVGHERGMSIMERADPLFLLVSLPLVPVGLVLGKMIRWEEPLLKALRRIVPQVPLGRYVLPIFCEVPDRRGLQAPFHPHSDSAEITRTCCGALFMPTIASFLGSILYQHVPSQLKRTILGGVTFLFVRGMLKIYHKQHAYVRQCKREILDYDAVR